MHIFVCSSCSSFFPWAFKFCTLVLGEYSCTYFSVALVPCFWLEHICTLVLTEKLIIHHLHYMLAGLRVTGDQRQMTSALPVHLVDVLAVSDGMHSFSDSSGIKSSLCVQKWLFLIIYIGDKIMLWRRLWEHSLTGMYMKNTPPISNSINNQGSLLQVKSMVLS